MVRVAWMSLVAALVMAGVAGAQQPQDPWVRDPEIGLTRSRYSGSAAVLMFSAHWCGYCEKLESFFLDPLVRSISDRTVLILVEVEGYPELLRRYHVEGHHQVVVIAWDGAELARLDVGEDPGKLLDTFRQAVCTNETDAAGVLLKVGRLSKAVERAEGVLSLVKEGAVAGRAKKLIEDVRERARREVAGAREHLKAGRLAECALACDGIVDNFPAKMVMGDVAKLRKDIERARRGRPPVEDVPVPKPGKAPKAVEVPAGKRAQDLVDRAMVAEWDGQYYQAMILYEQVLREFPGEKAAGDAWSRIKSLRESPRTAGLIATQEVDAECRRLIQMARAYAIGGHPAEARDYYNRVIKEHAGTDWARTAREELDKLKD